jgi:hypothetical protein
MFFFHKIFPGRYYEAGSFLTFFVVQQKQDCVSFFASILAPGITVSLYRSLYPSPSPLSLSLAFHTDILKQAVGFFPR